MDMKVRGCSAAGLQVQGKSCPLKELLYFYFSLLTAVRIERLQPDHRLEDIFGGTFISCCLSQFILVRTEQRISVR